MLHELPLGFTPLYAALRDAGADTAARNFAGRTPLHCAAAAGDFQLVRLLLRDGASAIATAHGGETPMHAAAAADAQSAPQLVHCIAAAGGDPDAPDDIGVTPLDVARSMPHGQATVVCLLTFFLLLFRISQYPSTYMYLSSTGVYACISGTVVCLPTLLYLTIAFFFECSNNH